MSEQITHAGTTYDITANGLVSDLYRQKHGDSACSELPNEDQVRVCLDWLAQHARKRKTVNHEVYSYGLKHIVERTVGYVSNGAFILAAHRAGYKIVPDDPLSLNAYFNISVPDIKKLRER